MKNFLLLFLLFSTSLLLGQSKVEASVGANRSYFHYKSSFLDTDQLNNLYAMENYGYNLFADVEYSRFFKKHLFFTTGLFLKNYSSSFEGNIGTLNFDIQENKKYSFIGVPFIIGTQTKRKQLNFSFYVGGSMNYLFSSKEALIYLDGQKDIETTQIVMPKKWYGASTVGSKVLIPIGTANEFSIGLENNFLLNSVGEARHLYEKNYYATGIKFGFSRFLGGVKK